MKAVVQTFAAFLLGCIATNFFHERKNNQKPDLAKKMAVHEQIIKILKDDFETYMNLNVDYQQNVFLQMEGFKNQIKNDLYLSNDFTFVDKAFQSWLEESYGLQDLSEVKFVKNENGSIVEVKLPSEVDTRSVWIDEANGHVEIYAKRSHRRDGHAEDVNLIYFRRIPVKKSNHIQYVQHLDGNVLRIQPVIFNR